MSTSGTPRPAGQRPSSSRPAGTSPRGPQQRTAGARPAQGPAGQRPGGGKAPQKGLVRPAPKAKVRKARLLVSKIDPWSVLKMAFLLSVALGIVTVVGAVVLWTTMDLTGIFDRVNDLMAQVLGSEGAVSYTHLTLPTKA